MVFLRDALEISTSDQSAWDVERKYVLKKEWLKKENVIAIRVYNGIGDGGIYGATSG